MTNEQQKIMQAIESALRPDTRVIAKAPAGYVTKDGKTSQFSVDAHVFPNQDVADDMLGTRGLWPLNPIGYEKPLF